MFWFAIAQLISAEPATKTFWFSDSDMPAYVQMAAINRVVETRTIVRPDGTIRDCEIELSSGEPALDKHTCNIILKRGRFTPARWADGSPVYGVDRFPISWVIGPPNSARPLPGDLNLTVNRLPKGARSPVTVGVMFAADETGRVVACAEKPVRWGSKPSRYPELVQIACGQFVRTYTAIPPKDDTGKPVRSVQTGRVRIERQR